MSFAATSIIVWWFLRPLIAANMLRIIGASLPSLAAAPSKRSGRPWLLTCPRSSGDDRGIDVREHVLAHVLPVDRRNDGAVLDRHHEGRRVHEDHGVARALARAALHARVDARQGRRVDR